MLKCPFCQFDNEDGALFCEQCKSDLSAVEATPAAAAPPVAAVVEETVPMAPVVEAAPIMEAAPIIEAAPIVEAAPMVAEVIEAAPVVEAVPEAAPQPPPVQAGIPEPPPAPPPPAPEPAPAPPAPTDGAQLPAGAQPRLVVIRGQKVNMEFPVYDGLNFIGRADEKPVDIDLEDQEPPERVWCSRQHAVISFEDGRLTIEDLNSANGTYLNRARVYPGQKQQLKPNDVVQIGTVQLKVKV